MNINIVLFTLSGLIILLLGANYLITNIVYLAKKLNISQLIIATCIIAFGTTLPELATSIKSILSAPPHPGMAVGNLIGSNIANILLIMGVAAIISPVGLDFIDVKKLINFEAKVSFIIVLFPATILFFKLEQNVTLYLAILMLFFFIYFFRERILLEKRNANKKENIKQSIFFIIFKIIFCIAGLIIGSRYLIDGSIQIAQYFKIPERVIGLSLLAVGTSLPELITAIIASIKKVYGIALGTVLGANTYNILVILSVVEIIEPSSILENTKNIDVFLLAISSILLIIFLSNDKKITRLEGLIFLFIYILYISSIY